MSVSSVSSSNISGINSSDSASMMWIQAQMATYAEKLSA